jgi:tRNA 2-thiouridine synthesizing protein A
MAARHVSARHVCVVMGVPLDWDVELDCAGLICPLPVLRARKRLIAMQTGQVLRLRATDPMAAIDVPHFCTEAGHVFEGTGQDEGIAVYLIRRG